MGGATFPKTPISRSALDKNPMPGHLFECNPVNEVTIRRVMTPQCFHQKKPQIPNTAQQVACHPVNNSRGKRSSIPQHKTRPDSPVPTLQGLCDPNQTSASEVTIGTLRFLPPLEIRTSSIARNPVESQEMRPSSTVSLTSQRHPEKLPVVTRTSRGNPGFPAVCRERPRDSFFKAS